MSLIKKITITEKKTEIELRERAEALPEPVSEDRRPAFIYPPRPAPKLLGTILDIKA